MLRIVNARMPLEDDSLYYDLTSDAGTWASMRAHPQRASAPGALRAEDLDADVLSREGPLVLDAEGRLLLPGFVDMHMHLDKAFTIRQVGNATGTLGEAIRNYSAASARFSREEIKQRIIRAALTSVSFGTTKIRTHLDFHVEAGPDVALRTIHAALEAREMLRDVVEIQCFPMVPLGLASPGVKEACEEALRLGVDGIGGAPHLSETAAEDVAWIFDAAARHDCPVDLHCDESDDPAVNTLDQILKQTWLHDYEGRVTVGHLCSLAPKPDAEAESLIARMAEARLGAVTLPAANMYLQGRGDRGIVRRGTTRIRELLAGGVPLATASDNIQDPFHPFGQGDLVQIGLLTAYAGHLCSQADLHRLLEMTTVIPAANIGVNGYGIRLGAPTEFVLVDSHSIEEMFTTCPAGRWVYKGRDWVHLSRRSTRWARQELSDLVEKEKEELCI